MLTHLTPDQAFQVRVLGAQVLASFKSGRRDAQAYQCMSQEYHQEYP